MSDIVIKVENLSKKYILRHHQQERYFALRDALTRGVKNIGRKLLSPFTFHASRFRASKEEFFALKDVSFEVRQGDRLGIIGRNGAGKTTLLKILSRITEPTGGCVEMTGRVASLLDVGTGFHPELTGRENTYLNGAILGMTRVEITRKFDEIVAFAGVEQFIDTPVKRYSTGMHARLAFAVAAHLDSDILMVDELLAVGDVEFQKRCLGKIESVAHGGRTVLLVSHQLAAVRTLCTHALWLDRGRMLFAGCPDEAIALYLASGSTARAERRWEPGPDAPFGADVRLLAARVLDPAGRASSVIDIRNPLVVEIEYELPRKLDYCMIGFTVMTSTGIEVFTSYDSQDGSVGGNPRLAGRYRSRCQIPGGLLNQGDYSISISTDLAFTERVLVEPDILRVSVEQTGGGGAGVSELRWPGVICPKLPWEVVSL